MRTALNAGLLVVLFFFTGCGSFASRWNGERGPYVGVQYDSDCVTGAEEGLLSVLACADMPLSLVMDTFFLPYDLTGKEPEDEPPPSEPPPSPPGDGPVGDAR